MAEHQLDTTGWQEVDGHLAPETYGMPTVADDIVKLLHAQLIACGCTQTSSRPSGQMVPLGCARCNAEEAAADEIERLREQFGRQEAFWAEENDALRDEIERLRAAGDALAYAFRYSGHYGVAYDMPLKAWEEARRG